jgi:hypothetical protein
MRWLNASRTACSAAVLALALAGCGGSGERLPVLTALHLARLADRVAAGQDCGAPLVQAAIAAVNQGAVPGPLQEPLLSDANRIAATCSRAAARALAARLRP